MSARRPARRPRPRPAHRRAGAARGFTLLELLAAVAIAGLAATAALLTLPDDDATLHRQADAFAQRLQHARDEAILGGRAVQVQVDAAGYRFGRRDFGAWAPLEEGPFAARDWRDGVAPLLPQRQQRLSFRFDPTGAAEPQAVALARGRTRATVAVDAAGRIEVHGRAR